MDKIPQFISDSKKIIFDEPIHKYTLNGKELISCTTFIKEFSHEFDPDGSILAKKAAKDGVSPKKLKKEWELKGEVARAYGKFFHKSIEYYLNTGKIKKDKHQETIKKFVADFKFSGSLYSEVLLFEPDLYISGTSDVVQIIDNKIVQCHDWKTNSKPITDYSFGKKMKYPIEHLNDSKLNHYFLQISLYLYILSSRYNYEIGPNNYIFWLNRKKEQLEKIPVELKLSEIQNMIAFYTYKKSLSKEELENLNKPKIIPTQNDELFWID